jgi:hypothetical protein
MSALYDFIGSLLQDNTLYYMHKRHNYIGYPVQWVPGVLSPGVKARPGRDADHSPPSSAEVENE